MRNVFVETANVQAFVSTARDLERRTAGVPGLALVHGNRGLGKTRSAIWYAAQNGAIYLRAKSVWSPSWMLEELAVELGVVPAKRKKELFTAVENALKEHPRLVIIDEANVPPTACIDCIRDLHDLTEAPMLLIGHEGIVTRLKRMGPFFDRFLYITEFKSLTASDLQRFAQVCLELPVAEDTLNEVIRITGGNFRKGVVLLTGAEGRAVLNRAKAIENKHLNVKRVA
ncbi:MAG: AAA family ATPase [Desulfovibrio sp.]|uniref:AAA family ATPase n=1 Tax=Desulfovibrio sp. 7SRBS1 TaxID=3378064 RepID=UPI003B41C666